MSTMARWASPLSVVVLLSTPSWADDDVGPEPAALELFRQGRELIKQGDWDQGCLKLELSMKRYAAPSTLMNIAACRSHEGRVATAWALYRRALVLNRTTDGEERRRELDDVGRAAIEELEPRLPRLRVSVSPEAQNARVTEGGRELPIGTAVPLDPGDYDVTASAPGFLQATRRVSLSEGKTTEIALELRPVPARTAPAPSAAATPSPVSDDDEVAPTPLWVWFVGGSAIVMSGVAIGFAIDARVTSDGLVERCGDDLVCDEDPSFDPADDNARKNRDIGLAIGFGIGAASAWVAAIIGLTNAPSQKSSVSVVPTVSRRMGGVTITATF
jgi:hypothetical protein